ncbi:MAG TPA: hypothetical protein VK816_00115, partial [Jatrophihabitantaceae bacterium]|nr:hypothetical protein [Jatrophihabitantaceae bacterium]
VFLIMPGAVGDNITRLSWVCAVPIVAACAPLPRRLLVGALALLAIWPVADMVEQMSATGNPSAKASFYQPLSDHLAQAQAAVGNSALGERVEVIDPDNHWASVYLSSLSLARGWDRQADNADNPIFYKQGLLNATSYHQWLNQLAVGWVALPAVPLDYASVAEAKLVGSGLSYLDLVWSSPQWRLYRVDQPAPLADGATVTAVEPGSLTLDVPSASASNVSVRVRWSPYLVTVDPVTQRTIPSCIADADGWVQLYLPGAARVELTSHFDPAHRLSASDQACIQSLAGTEPG